MPEHRELLVLLTNYKSDMNLITFSFQDFIVLIASSTLLGLAGSWIAVARHLNQIEPT